MKKLLVVLLMLAISGTVVMADSFSDAIDQAHKLKAKGDYEGAAKVTPRTLCAAMYYWNAACEVVGHKDSKGDWAINGKLSEADKAEGLRLLGLAQEQLDAALTIDKDTVGDNGTCKGVDPVSLKDLIEKVKDCINGNCQ